MKSLAKSKHSVGAAKYTHVTELFRERLEAGDYAVGSRLPTEVELARELNINPQTVSRAMRELVRDGLIVRRRGDGSYVTDRRRPPLVAGRHVRLGILWQHSIIQARMDSAFQGAMTRGALEAWKLDDVVAQWAQPAGQEPTRAAWNSPARGASIEALGEAWSSGQRHPPLEVVRAGRFDGLLCLSIIAEEFIAELLDLGIPTVLVDFPNDRFADKADQVFADAGPGYRAAVRHFAGRGLTRIHFVGCLQSVPRNERRLGHLEWRGTSMRIDPDSPLRQGAYRQAMSELGLPVSENMIHHAMFDAEFNAALAEKLLLLPASERPEAVLCHSAEHASALTAAFAARGLKLAGAGVRATLPEEETPFIHADGGALGAAAAQLLLWRLANPERPPLRVGAAMRFVANTNETGETQ